MAEETRKETYEDQLRNEFGAIIGGLELEPMQKRFLDGRWLDQLLWFERKSGANQRRFYALRIVTIVGGVIVPALVSLNIGEEGVRAKLAYVTFTLSLIVAIAAAIEGFFGYGERWRTFRRTAEALKAQGWQFFELVGPYAVADHKTAFPIFATQVEILVQQDIEAFIAQAAHAKAGRGDEQPAEQGVKPLTGRS